MICLDAEAIRQEIREPEAGVPGHMVPVLLALPDEELNIAINEVANDHFWSAFDSTRSDAITWLLRRHEVAS